MPINTTNNNRFVELLDSDDELPLEYTEVSTTPAYQIDSRFDMIQFKWINNFKTYDNLKQCSMETSSTCTSTSDSEIKYPVTDNNNYNQTPVIQRGVLNKHDLFCLKSIEGFAGDSTLIWLINFLLHKDLQSGYMFLKSCLVSNNLNNETLDYKYVAPSESKHLYKILINI
nr:uncharacterized protein LOC113401974 [Vanessa tameamea]